QPTPGAKHGVNLGNFDPALIASVRVRRFDGANTWKFIDEQLEPRRSRAMSEPLTIRRIQRSDYGGWRPLWDGYNALYRRKGPTALPEQVTQATWERFFNAAEPIDALVAEESGRLVGLAHCVFHRSTTRLHDVCYLQDLFTAENLRGQGIGRRL